MNDTPELDVVDLGDAKDLTKGWLSQLFEEDNPEYPTRPLF
jgi:hypothetical protein